MSGGGGGVRCCRAELGLAGLGSRETPGCTPPQCQPEYHGRGPGTWRGRCVYLAGHPGTPTASLSVDPRLLEQRDTGCTLALRPAEPRGVTTAGKRRRHWRRGGPLTVDEGDGAADAHARLEAHGALHGEGLAVEEGGDGGGQRLHLVNQPAGEVGKWGVMGWGVEAWRVEVYGGVGCFCSGVEEVGGWRWGAMEDGGCAANARRQQSLRWHGRAGAAKPRFPDQQQRFPLVPVPTSTRVRKTPKPSSARAPLTCSACRPA